MDAAIYEKKGLDLRTLKRESPLDRWFYEMVQKKESQLSLLDISRMLRQEVFLDIAIPASEVLLASDPLCGEMFDGQLLELLLRVLKVHPEEKQKIRFLQLKESILINVDQYLLASDIDESDFRRMLSDLCS